MYYATCGLSGCTIFFHIISQTSRFSENKYIEHKMCVFIFSTNFSETLFILTRIQRDIINVHMFSYKVPVILVRF
jgi:hypothetical protein